MRRIAGVACFFALVAAVSPALAGECANPNALGTSRTLVIDTSHKLLGAQQYNETLPLADREVVLTFDDGPLGAYTTRILDLLAADCVKATYFLVGTMAQNNPALVQRIQREGHTIGTHSRSHPLTFDRMPLENAQREIDGGISLVQAALGDHGKLAPFFRIPGLLRSSPVEAELAKRNLVTWSVDLVADDWHRGITADDIANRALRRIQARGRGILLLHDIHPATALAMPKILRGLKAGGYRIVHVVPASATLAKTPSDPQQWAAHGAARRIRVAVTEGGIDMSRPVPEIGFDLGKKTIASEQDMDKHLVMKTDGSGLRLSALWSDDERTVVPASVTADLSEDTTHWTLHDRLAATAPSGDAVWPAVKARGAAEPSPAKEPSKKAQKKHDKQATQACKSGDTRPRCKRNTAGHQLSMSGDGAPSALRQQYSF